MGLVMETPLEGRGKEKMLGIRALGPSSAPILKRFSDLNFRITFWCPITSHNPSSSKMVVGDTAFQQSAEFMREQKAKVILIVKLSKCEVQSPAARPVTEPLFLYSSHGQPCFRNANLTIL